ncbi:extracellular solute-binding protein [Oceanicoccus sagamiensis]|uniref:Solute-binding protein family 5 domain-containing protein n=1 Tax=Oceanicoccus sagamiensis TaxID=716816 RepID=A0A1X9NLZ8_9GAMM|nr:extracellular solute-binding protein [Oceanicoccus sagamiensis]ARN75857.1 hypothetical protein BST96_18165 [Oceanicoccus sagamiensis]
MIRNLLVAFSIYTLATSALAAPDNHSSLIHGIAMHGEVKYPADFQRFDYTSAQAVKGGTLRRGLQGTFDSLNPFIAKGSSGDKLSLLYDTLTVQSGDEAFSQYGLLAEHIEIPEDRSWVIFHLHKTAKFHDGEAVKASDVVFTFNLLMEQGAPFYRSYYGGVSTVEALSPHQVKFTFKDGVNRELALIIGQLPVLPEHYWSSRDFSASSLEFPLGSGPYQIQSADAGRSIVYQRVKDYWAEDLPVNRGINNFDTIQIDYYKDGVVVLEALKAGRFDFRWENISKQWATSYTGPAFDQGLLQKSMIEHDNPSGMQCFLINLRKDKFKDSRVRQALNYAFDYEWSNKNLFYGLYARTNSFFANSELASSGIPEGRELEILEEFRGSVPDSVFTQTYTNPISDGSGNNRGNLRKAAKLLKEAGWVVKDNQLVNAKTGQPFTIEMIIYAPSSERIVNPYAKALKRLGIVMTVKNVEISQYINRMRSFDYDMVTGGMGQSLSPGNEQMEYWHSSSADKQGSRNYAGIQNKAIDKLVELVIAAPSREELVYRTRALDRVLLHNHYVVPQFHSGAHRIAYWDKFGQPDIAPKYDSGYSMGLMTWWVDPDKEKQLNNAKQSIKQ